MSVHGRRTGVVRRSVRVLCLLLPFVFVVAGCGSGSAPEFSVDGDEIRFQSGVFELVGDLHEPDGPGPHPAVIIVHGDGPQSRSSTPGTSQILSIFGDAGFAVFAWDKPGSGASTGEFEQGQTLRQRARILADAVAVLEEHPDVDAERIGFWGISQAGWVMPLALELTDSVAFMIVVSGGGEDSIDQLAYQLGQGVVCQGASSETGRLVEEYFPQTAKGTSYDEYLEAMDVLMDVDGWEQFAGPELKSESEWQPWPAEIDAYFDPMTVVEKTTIPVLAVFGELDRWIDPIQGAAAYEQALRSAGNSNHHVELIPGVGHTMQSQQTTCGSGGTISERYLELLREWADRLKE